MKSHSLRLFEHTHLTAGHSHLTAAASDPLQEIEVPLKAPEHCCTGVVCFSEQTLLCCSPDNNPHSLPT